MDKHNNQLAFAGGDPKWQPLIFLMIFLTSCIWAQKTSTNNIVVYDRAKLMRAILYILKIFVNEKKSFINEYVFVYTVAVARAA